MNKTPTRPPYAYKLQPLGKQLEVIENTWHEPRWALLCRPGTGKTKMSLDTAGMLYMAGEIGGLIILGLNGVHRQWVEEGIPTHLSDSIPWTGGVYDSGLGKRAADKLFKSLTTRDMGMRVLAITFEGLQTKQGKEFAHALAVSHRCLLVIDESHNIANTKGAGWRAALKLASMCPYRRIATGTLLRQDPFAAYGQFELLGRGLLGYTSLTSFKSMYAEMLPPTSGLVKHIADQFLQRTGKKINPQVIAKGADDKPLYKNLGHLRKRLLEHSSMITLEDVQGTEPTVLQSTRYVVPTAQQTALYRSLQEDGVAEHRGGVLTADTALVLGTRLSQVVGGFVPNDDDPQAHPCTEVNPKVNEILALAHELAGEKLVVWCRYTAEIAAVVKALTGVYGLDAVVRYDGTISGPEKGASKRRFIDVPECRYFVGQVKAGGTGLDGLQAVASYMAFYSNDYSYLLREQAVARLARTSGKLVVNVIDIMMDGTVDNDVVRCMQTAQDVHIAVLKRHMPGNL
jgi:hypothetical protein